jgi:hypothetical protein
MSPATWPELTELGIKPPRVEPVSLTVIRTLARHWRCGMNTFCVACNEKEDLHTITS